MIMSLENYYGLNAVDGRLGRPAQDVQMQEQSVAQEVAGRLGPDRRYRARWP